MSKVWFITGAGSGIEAATARAALKSGDRVVATGSWVLRLGCQPLLVTGIVHGPPSELAYVEVPS